MTGTVCCTYLGPPTAEAVQNPPLKASAVLKFSEIIKSNLHLGRGSITEVCMKPKCLFPTQNLLSQTPICGKLNLIYLQAFSSGVAETEEAE